MAIVKSNLKAQQNPWLMKQQRPNINAGSQLDHMMPNNLLGSHAKNDLNSKQRSQIPKGSEIVTFDLDETLISCNKLTTSMKAAGEKLGYQLRTSSGGHDYFIRPGAVELLKWIKEQGFTVVVSSRNFRSYEKEMLSSSPLGQYVDHSTGHIDLVESANDASKEKYPNHPNNKIGFFRKCGRIVKSFVKAFFVDFLYRGFMHYVMRNKNMKPYFPIAKWKLNKYPPYLAGSRIMIDNLYDECKTNSKASEDWVAVDPGEFYGDKEEPKNENGEYVWVANIKRALNIAKNNGWQELYRREYEAEPIDEPVPAAQAALDNPVLASILST